MASSNNTTMSTEEYIEMLREEMIPETIVYTASWIVGTAGNLFILQQLHSNNVPKSKINFMIKHLAIADLIVIWFTITIEIAWRICVTWNTPDYGCRILQMMRTFGLYLTSMIVISITLDRFYAFVYPMSVFDSKHRNRKFLILSYVIATACSIPNGIVFHLMEHPNFPGFHQCVTIGFFDHKWTELAYNTASICGFYLIPVTVIIVCYTIILRNIDIAAAAGGGDNSTSKRDARQGGTGRAAAAGRSQRGNCRTKLQRKRSETSLMRTGNREVDGESDLTISSNGIQMTGVSGRNEKMETGLQNERALYSGATDGRLERGEPFDDREDRVTGDECIHLSSAQVTILDHDDSRIDAAGGSNENSSPREKEASNCVQPPNDNGSIENSGEIAHRSPKPSEGFSLQSQNRKALMARAKRKTLRMSILIVVTFVICWTPYAMMLLWELIDKESLVRHIPEWIRALLYILAVINSCINPFIHSRHIFVQYFKTSRFFYPGVQTIDVTLVDQRNIRSVTEPRETHL